MRLLLAPADGCSRWQPLRMVLRGRHRAFWGDRALRGQEEPGGESKRAGLEAPARLTGAAVRGHAGGCRGASGFLRHVPRLLRIPGQQGAAARGRQSRARHR